MKNTVHSLLTGAFTQRDITIEAGQELDLGANPNQFQTIKVITGYGVIQKNAEEIPVKTDDLIQIHSGYRVKIKATGNFDLELFITGSGHV